LSFNELINKYRDDLPHLAVLYTEMFRWKMKWLQQSAEDRPSTLERALSVCDKNFFPNMHVLLKIACTLPVASCENERVNSTLANVKTGTMGQEQLSSLIMNVHNDMPISFDDIVDRYELVCHRRNAL